jgi:putative hydrolase of the HAD superfamily
LSEAGPPPIRAILLDALGTLLELQPPARFLVAEMSSRFGIELSESEAEYAIAAEIAFYRRHLDEGRDPRSLGQLRHRCAGALRDAMPRDATARLPPAAEMVDALLASLRFRVYPEVRSALSSRRQRGLRLVVVSNWDVSLHDVLARAGLTALLDGVVTSAEAGARKPSPAIFEQALRIAGVPAPEAIHVGDTLDEDVAGARAAGISPVLLRRDGGPGASDVMTIATLAELPV